MAVPKKKTSKSRKRMRRSHDFLKPITCSICNNCGKAKLAHHICTSCGHYKGRYVFDRPKEEDEYSSIN
jgi:large subunit ribosomal protein L32